MRAPHLIPVLDREIRGNRSGLLDQRHWSKEIAVKEFSSIQSCPSSVIQKDEHSLALGSELLTTGSSGCSRKDLGPGRETTALEALTRLVMYICLRMRILSSSS